MKHKERVQRVKNFTEKNKVFVIMAVVAVIFLCSNFFFSKEDTVEKMPETSQSEIDENAEKIAEKPQWQFYWTDLWILLGVGGFCTIMIIRERKKSKEELQ